MIINRDGKTEELSIGVIAWGSSIPTLADQVSAHQQAPENPIFIRAYSPIARERMDIFLTVKEAEDLAEALNKHLARLPRLDREE